MTQHISQNHTARSKFLVSFGCFAVLLMAIGLAGAVLFDPSLAAWWEQLDKPVWTPSSGLMVASGIVVSAISAFSAARIWCAATSSHRFQSLALLCLQLILIWLWGLAFFGFQSLWAGATVALLLCFTLHFLVRTSWSVDRDASIALVPCFMWTVFGSLLNTVVAVVN